MTEIDQAIVSYGIRSVRGVVRHRTMSHECEISEYYNTKIAQHEERSANFHPLHSYQYLFVRWLLNDMLIFQCREERRTYHFSRQTSFQLFHAAIDHFVVFS